MFRIAVFPVEMLLQVKSGHCAGRIQLGICTRSLSVFQSVLLRELKWKWAPSPENNVENVCSAVCFSNNSISQTAKGTDVVTLWVHRGCNSAVFSPCRENSVSAAHQALWYRLSVCWHPQPSLPPAGSSGHRFLEQGQSYPGHRGASGSWVLPEADLHLPLAPGRLSLGGNTWLFYPCFGVLKVWGVWLPRLPTAFLARRVLSDTDVPRLHLILPQKQHNFSALFFILRMRDAP